MAIRTHDHQRLSKTFAALADPTRRAILARLAQGDASVSELMEPFSLSQPTVSKHLRVLEDAGLIEQGRDAQRRPRRLKAAAFDEAAGWIDDFRKQWIKRLDRLEAHLARVKTKDR